jgi:hypothetical protein
MGLALAAGLFGVARMTHGEGVVMLYMLGVPIAARGVDSCALQNVQRPPTRCSRSRGGRQPLGARHDRHAFTHVV